MKNLFICLTPLQTLIAQHLIRQTAPIPADLLMVYYKETDNAKFQHYYQETAKLCDFAKCVRVPQNKWSRKWTLLSLTKNLQKQYNTIYAASIDNPNVQYPISQLAFKQLITFDDGTANLYPNSLLYQNQHFGKKSLIIRKLQGLHYTTEELRALSSQHHTLYPQQNNIVHPTIPLNLWHNHAPNEVSGSLSPTIHTILLGQPLFEDNNQNIDLFYKIINKTQVKQYFPHPRESYIIEHINYIHSHLIFEDYLLQNLQQNPHDIYHIYHIASTAALNVANFPNVKVFTLRPNLPIFHQPHFQYLYDLIEKMNIPIQNTDLTS